jgi:hypothetical protein
VGYRYARFRQRHGGDLTGPIRIVENGEPPALTSAEQLISAETRRIMGVNYFGQVRGCRAALRCC